MNIHDFSCFSAQLRALYIAAAAILGLLGLLFAQVIFLRLPLPEYGYALPVVLAAVAVAAVYLFPGTNLTLRQTVSLFKVRCLAPLMLATSFFWPLFARHEAHPWVLCGMILFLFVLTYFVLRLARFLLLLTPKNHRRRFILIGSCFCFYLLLTAQFLFILRHFFAAEAISDVTIRALPPVLVALCLLPYAAVCLFIFALPLTFLTASCILHASPTESTHEHA